VSARNGAVSASATTDGEGRKLRTSKPTVAPVHPTRGAPCSRGEARNIADRQFVVSGKWALASDGLQWILQRKRSGRPPWRAVSFVRSTKDILARCMGENGATPDEIRSLLAGLPDTFDQWKSGAGLAPAALLRPHDGSAGVGQQIVPSQPQHNEEWRDWPSSPDDGGA
jgi:hypothetical protein